MHRPFKTIPKTLKIKMQADIFSLISCRFKSMLSNFGTGWIMSIKWFRSDRVCRQRKFVPLIMGNAVFLLLDDGGTLIRSRLWLKRNARFFNEADAS
ncbi:hypothetical protein C2E15_10580 [Mixta gaviniae]|uniref:Uncharacterized protein n=1 Tax=Mixta gaviniae TaxID=665914 RepID=A0A1X1D6K8_9GAMM|nr:hypothetical protein C2E15_10580 [Mixta gaviniae]ORM72319.1 hypothetical protein HA44_20445 [Mixta gaviniae]